MRLAGVFVVLVTWAAGVTPLAVTATPAHLVVAAAQAPPAVPPGEPTPARPSPLAVETEEPTAGADWGPAAIWIAIGFVALALLVVAIVFSIRGGGRTVLKE